MRYLTAAGTVFSHLTIVALYTLVFWGLVRISKTSFSFLNAFKLMIHSYFVLVLGQLSDTLILYYQGIENINSIYEISLTGLNVFTSVERVGATMYSFLMSINPFYIWFVGLLTVGLTVFTGMKTQKAFIISFIFWMLLIMYTVATIYFSQVVIQRSGINIM